MGFFKRKSEEVEADEPEARTLPRVRDLSSENQKRRKEPVKPWGRKERLIVLVALLITVIIPATLAISAREWKLPGMPRIPKLGKINVANPFSVFDGDTIVIEGDGPTPKANNIGNNSEILGKFKAKTDNLSGVYGLYVERADATNYGLFQDEVFQAASLIKLPVIVAFYREVQAGRLSLNSKYALLEADKIGGSGSIQYKPAGTIYTYTQLVDLMGSQSDNTAFNVVRKILGDEKIGKTIVDLGMKSTSLTENETSPRDIGKLLSELDHGSMLNKIYVDKIFVSLTDTIYEQWLVAGVPEYIRVAHKYGREVHVINDAGVVFAKSRYIVVLMSKGVVEKEGDAIFPVLSKLIYDWEEK